ncbi:MAG: HAMP domain-containing protein [Anaerolineae bacterium]|nr:HAMP domain-containing protein [Anaerolineae bacterium]
MKSELARRKRVIRRLRWATVAANGVAALVAETFFVLNGTVSQGTEFSSSKVGNYYFFGGLVIVALLALGSWLGARRDHRVWGWYLDPDTIAASRTAPPDTQRLALNEPFVTALVSMAMWGLAGFTFGIGSAFSPEGIDWRELFLVQLSIFGLSGGIAAVLVFFIVERLWRPELPIFFPNGDLSQSPAFRMTIRRRVMVLFVMQAIPLILLAAVSYSQAMNLIETDASAEALSQLRNLEIFLVAVGLTASLTLGLTLGASLVEGIEQLRKRMTAVRNGDLETVMPVTSNDELGELAEGFNAMVRGLQQEEVIRRLFSLYVTPEVAEHAITHGARLGGQLTEATVLFSDIRGFTSIAEGLSPDVLIALLNRYFDAMSGVVLAEGGFVNKFGGDSLLAVFGTPLNPDPQHPVAALRAARGMLAALEDFNQAQRRNHEPELRIGVGVATGPVVVGNIGSEDRLEYTVIGDTVNLASRLEAMTKELGTPVLVAAHIPPETGETPVLLPMGDIEVRGKTQTVPVWALQLA